MRQWIVPGTASVREVDNELYILEATLKVTMEADHVLDSINLFEACPNLHPATRQHNDQVFRSLILPELQRAVDEAPEYAALRRIYLSRVAAEWYRRRSGSNRTAYADLVGRGDITPWVSREPWSPRAIFDEYVRSYHVGEYKVTRETQRGNAVQTWTYTLGGVDFSKVPELNVSNDEFQRTWPYLTTLVGRSLEQPVREAAGERVWLGGSTVPPPPDWARWLPPITPLWLKSALIMFGVPGLALGGGVVGIFLLIMLVRIGFRARHP